MDKRCQKGKSCGATCISRVDRCVLELGELVSGAVGKLKGFVSNLLGKPKTIEKEVKVPEGSYKVRGSGKAEGDVRGRRSLIDAFSGKKGRQNLSRHIESLKLYLYDKSDKEVKQIAKSQFKENKNFVKRLSRNLPSGVGVIVGGQIIQMSAKTGTGDRVAVYYSPKIGFHFSVNGSNDVGTVKTRRGQIQVTSLVRSLYDATVRSLPEGAVLRTRAHTEDGRGEKRTSIYNKLGFSAPGKAGEEMFGVVGPGNTVSPSSKQSWRDQRRSPSSVYFNEGSGKLLQTHLRL